MVTVICISMVYKSWRLHLAASCLHDNLNYMVYVLAVHPDLSVLKNNDTLLTISLYYVLTDEPIKNNSEPNVSTSQTAFVI